MTAWEDALAARGAWGARKPIPADAMPITMGLDAREPGQLARVIAQFDVEAAARYQPCAGATRGIVLASDVATACGVELPRWLTPTGRPGAPSRANRELDVAGLVAWLTEQAGPRAGVWREVRVDAAVRVACLGFPVWATWHNPTGCGDIACLLPILALDGPFVAHAGTTCRFACTLVDAFGAHAGDAAFWFSR